MFTSIAFVVLLLCMYNSMCSGLKLGPPFLMIRSANHAGYVLYVAQCVSYRHNVEGPISKGNVSGYSRNHGSLRGDNETLRKLQCKNLPSVCCMLSLSRKIRTFPCLSAIGPTRQLSMQCLIRSSQGTMVMRVTRDVFGTLSIEQKRECIDVTFLPEHTLSAGLSGRIWETAKTRVK